MQFVNRCTQFRRFALGGRRVVTDCHADATIKVVTIWYKYATATLIATAEFHVVGAIHLLAGCEPGDVLLVEQVDRLSRLTSADWIKLRAEIDTKQVRIVALDLPTSWNLAAPADEFTGRMFAAVNNMMLDVLAAVARKD